MCNRGKMGREDRNETMISLKNTLYVVWSMNCENILYIEK
jgi:hypothetical protein